MIVDRQREDARDESIRAGIGLYGQTLTGLCLFLTEYIGASAWLAVGLAGPFLLLCRCLAKRGRPLKGKARFLAAAGTAWLDALAAYTLLCALCVSLLPDLHPFLPAALTGVFAVAGLSERDRAVTALGRPLAALILLAVFLSALTALPQGRIGRLFPLLGKGADRLAAGALWTWGCGATACFPWLLKREEDRDAPSPPGLPLAAALLAAVLTALVHALLLPFPALTRPAWAVDRLVLLREASPPAAMWPLLTAALLLLLFYTLLSSLKTACRCIAGAGARGGRGTAALLTLLMLPVGASQDREAIRLLILALPLRAVAALCLLLSLRGKRGNGKEAASRA